MKTEFIPSGTCHDTDLANGTDHERMECMRELLTDLRTSIQTQRHLIDVSRALLDRN